MRMDDISGSVVIGYFDTTVTTKAVENPTVRITEMGIVQTHRVANVSIRPMVNYSTVAGLTVVERTVVTRFHVVVVLITMKTD